MVNIAEGLHKQSKREFITFIMPQGLDQNFRVTST
jgi:hypothetical protein